MDLEQVLILESEATLKRSETTNHSELCEETGKHRRFLSKKFPADWYIRQDSH
jgi:hypothetical protein